MSNYLDRLNPQQRAAVMQTEGPLLILAGAGSGKTRVLTCRVARLLEMGVPAWKILAITFTNKAAKEMVDRVNALAGEAAEEAWVSTFHSCCARILRRDIEKMGYKRSFTIYDEDDRMSVIRRVAKELQLNDKEYPPKVIRAVISDAKNRMLTPDEWFTESGGDTRSKNLAEAYKRYEKELKGNNALDFDDLLIKTLELLSEHPPVLEYYQNRFDYVMVDEYQDTNPAQYQLVRLLAGRKRNLCVVGDDDQSIYGWRGADIRNILDFEKDFPDCTVIKLEQNYRSTANILDAANQVIAHNTGRKEKELWTEIGEGEKICLYHAMDERDEAAFTARMAEKLIKEGTNPGQIAVLYRTNAQSRVIEEAFIRQNVPNRVYGGQRFYDRKEVKDLIAYLRVLANNEDDVSVRRVINEPKRGIGETTVDKLNAYAEANGMSLMAAVLACTDAGLPAAAAKKVGGFAELMMDLTDALYSLPLTEFMSALIEKTGYVRILEQSNTNEDRERIENIRELEGAVADYVERNPDTTLDEFLENVALITDIDNLNQNGGAATLMTLHAAKGLEFEAVFIVGMEESIFPSGRALFDENQMEEERRLAYVGITRAQRRLFLSHARTRALYNQRSANQISRFIGEIPRRLIREGVAKQQMTVGRPIPQARGAQLPSYSSTGAGYPVRKSAADNRAQTEYTRPIMPGVSVGSARSVGNAAAPQYSADFKPGDRVVHRVFGRGTVEKQEEGYIYITFDNGQLKRFRPGAAPISKV